MGGEVGNREDCPSFVDNACYKSATEIYRCYDLSYSSPCHVCIARGPSGHARASMLAPWYAELSLATPTSLETTGSFVGIERFARLLGPQVTIHCSGSLTTAQVYAVTVVCL